MRMRSSLCQACLVIAVSDSFDTHAHWDAEEKSIFPDYADFGAHMSKS